MTPDELARYADAVIDTCLHIKKGDTVAVHGEPGSRPYVQALVESAYASGARFVDVLYVDPVIRRARITGAKDVNTLKWTPRWHLTRMKDLIAADASLISIAGEENPGLMKGVDPKRAMLEMTARMPGREAYLKAVAAGTARFCVVAYPAPGWARQVYPKLSVERAQRALAKDLLSFCRIGASDPAGAWGKHVENLVKREPPDGGGLREPGLPLHRGPLHLHAPALARRPDVRRHQGRVRGWSTAAHSGQDRQAA